MQVFTPYQGRIIGLFASLGDDVKKGQTLFTIDSPDLLQAESTLIAAAGVLELTTRNSRASPNSIRRSPCRNATSIRRHPIIRPPKAICARGASRCASSARPTPTSIASSPITAPIRRWWCRARSPAGSRRAMPRPDCSFSPEMRRRPLPSADTDIMWMLAQVPELDSPAFRVGQPMQVMLNAFPDRVFDGKIITIGPSVDANTRRVFLRSEIKDPQHSLRSGMFANFVIRIGPPNSFAGDSARWRRARRRWHHDRLGDGGSAPVHRCVVKIGRLTRRRSANS